MNEPSPYRQSAPLAEDEPELGPRRPNLAIAHWCLGLCFGTLPISFALAHPAAAGGGWKMLFVLLLFAQVGVGGGALIQYTRYAYGPGAIRRPSSVLSAIVVVLVGAVAAFVAWAVYLVTAINWGGGAWGRPLRVRGRIVHPELRHGEDWAAGGCPDVSELDTPTRAALEALWLHDAQKEHASVPAFARITWMLAAVGAPPHLMEQAHRAGLEETDHARRCFALAAGYGGRAHTVEAMPDLLVGGLDVRGNPMVTMAVESLRDGCLLEDYNSDIAGACAAGCKDAVTRDVLERITREEKSHAEFSWALLEWLIARGGSPVKRALDKALADLADEKRPTAVSPAKRALVEAADPTQLRAHGRLPDAEWAPFWSARVSATRARAAALLASAWGEKNDRTARRREGRWTRGKVAG